MSCCLTGCRMTNSCMTSCLANKGKIMLSINDHPDIRNLFKDFRIAQFELTYSIGRSKTGKTSGELAICNW